MKMVLIAIWILQSLLHCSVSKDIVYHVKEENSPVINIGDITADSQLKDTALLSFSQLQQKGTQLFNVTNTGKIYTTQTLDAESLCTFEKECFHTIKVAVHKAGKFIKILKIKVIIEDINDHQPEFPVEQIKLELREGDGKGRKKSIPNAIDKDVGLQNRLVNYELKGSNQQFSLSTFKRADGVSFLEIILQGKLDRETKDSYNIEVIAKDGGTPPKQGVLNVHITVKDENDNRPIFSEKTYNVSIQNNHQRNRPVVVMMAEDSDIGENGKVSYYISPTTSTESKDNFIINEKTGEIFLAKESQFDKMKSFKLYIEARDGGNPPLSSIATVMVNVINQHNNPPNIDVNFISAQNHNTATILEDIKVGSFIAYVMVTDNDVGHNGEVNCHIKDDTFKLQSMGSKEYKIVLKKAVDRETQEHYHFTVSCEDKGLPALKTDKDLSIQVLDVNDVEPHFTKDTFKFLTYENDKANFPIGFINATDPDIGKGGELSYSLRNKQQYRLPFQIINSGFISTNQSLDREHRDFYEFEVFVKDNGSPSLNNTVNVEVEVLDRNDNAPYFTFPSVDPFTLNVHYHPQSKNDITVLKASDIDSHMNAFLRYEIVSGNERQLFKLDSFTGVLSYSRTVYQNDAGSYELEFVVKDSGTPVLSATTSVSLTLTVSNKTSPMFTAVHLPSDNTIDATLLIIIVVAAVIVSIAIVVSITLCIVRCNNVRNSSSERTAEEKQAYQCRNEMRQLIYQGNNSVPVMSGNRGEMTDRYGHSRSHYYPDDWKMSTMNRTLQKSTKQKYSQPIEVTSYGDNRPSSHYPTDTLTSRKSSGQCWSERSSRQYEEIPAMSGRTTIYSHLILQLIDWYLTQQMKMVLIAIWILQSLLHCSVSKDIVYHVKEENSPVINIGDITADSQLKDTALLSFSQLQQKGTQLFNVTNTGKIYTTQTLDAESLCTFEKECFHTIKVAVHKAGKFIKILKIKVIIEDINDHQPEFPVEEIQLTFGEGDRNGMKKSIPNAIDKDVGLQNRLVNYELKGSNQQFSLSTFKRADGVSFLEIILQEKLDRETKDSYNIEVIAKDGGTPPKQGVLNVHITVEDENDNRPIFSEKTYNVSIQNNHQRNRPVVVMMAEDSDIGENGKVSYYISPTTSTESKDNFIINEKTGEIFLNKESQFDKMKSFKLYIEARDGGNPPLSSIATVMVNVINQQNNPPNIDVNYISTQNHNTATILEDIKVGSFIAYVMVTDNDVGHNGQVNCHIKDDTFKLQSMGSKEYKIVLKKAVDRETQEHYHFTVSCEDKGLPALKTDKDLSIQVLDVNDVEPHFTKDTFKFLTYENDKANFPIGFINATDPDIGKGGELSYSLRNKQQYRLPFQIINSGFISTNQSLDREHRDFYEFEVFVKDNGSPSLNNTVNVEVEVLDRNDNAPYFTFPSVDPFTLNVHYHPQSKNDITVLKASDIDSHMNAFLRYEIVSGNERQLFKLDSFTGVLSYSRTVYQNDAGSYELEFVVKDSGTPVLSATTSVSLTLTVSNKTSPMFTAVHLPSDNTIDATLLIIIVVAAVIVSIAIVVSITLCIVRCNNVRNSSSERTAEEKQAYQCRNEMRQLIYQGNNSVPVMSGNRGEMSDRYGHSRSHYYPDDWKMSTMNRTLQKSTRQKYSQPIEVTSYGDNRPSSHYPTDTLTSRKSSGQCWSERSSRQYEEIPAMSGRTTIHSHLILQ
ncbi:protocadherin Fat 1-like [Octopus vulgaris]|uniref:Protocadherin Fat 1-like n=2 Tax=Octopus vulgaris TaxID=6645 RepID=A0AA36BFI9_OCTVU|nr:protocadherin Fat 1-like [Octopus vulgaris]